MNLELYKQQLKDIERSFGALLRQLPGRTEVPSLLVDISQTGLSAGLEEKLFQPQPEVRKDFYAELPIKIRLTGSYHQFGEFVSGLAALPRIVTLHDIDIKPDNKDAYDQLSLELTAKTYRYLDEDEIAAGEAEKKADVRTAAPSIETTAEPVTTYAQALIPKASASAAWRSPAPATSCSRLLERR